MAPILPNLQTLSVAFYNDPSVTTVFLSSSITNLTITGEEFYLTRQCSSEDLMGLFQGLGSMCPNLRVLSLDVKLFSRRGNHTDSPTLDQSSLFILMLQGLSSELRNFTLSWKSEPGIDPVVLEVARLRSLESFTLKRAQGGSIRHLTWNNDLNKSVAHTFIALRHLNIGLTISNLHKLLGDVSPGLKELVVGELYCQATMIGLGKVLQALPRFTSLMLFDACVTDADQGVTSRDFHSLRYCTSLKVLRIISSSAININDDDLEAVLTHFPNLTDLEIQAALRSGSPPNFTLRSISSTVISCPLISSISLRVDAKQIEDDPPQVVRPAPTLRDLCVQNSPVDDSLVVAGYLAPLIALESCRICTDVWPGGVEVDWRKWRRVAERVRGLVRDRRLYGER